MWMEIYSKIHSVSLECSLINEIVIWNNLNNQQKLRFDIVRSLQAITSKWSLGWAIVFQRWKLGTSGNAKSIYFDWYQNITNIITHHMCLEYTILRVHSPWSYKRRSEETAMLRVQDTAFYISHILLSMIRTDSYTKDAELCWGLIWPDLTPDLWVTTLDSYWTRARMDILHTSLRQETPLLLSHVLHCGHTMHLSCWPVVQAMSECVLLFSHGWLSKQGTL